MEDSSAMKDEEEEEAPGEAKAKPKGKGKGKRSWDTLKASDEGHFPLTPRKDVVRPTKRQANAIAKLLLSYLDEPPTAPLSSSLSVRRRLVRGKVSLIPKSKPKARVSDVMMAPRVTRYVALLDNIASDTVQGTVWHTLTFDCFAFSFFKRVTTQLLDPGFPFDKMAGVAGNCLIEFSMTDNQYTALNNSLIQLQGTSVVQDLTPRTWWILGTQRVHMSGTIVATMTWPEQGSVDPTTIVTNGIETVTFIRKMNIPSLPALQILVAMSHGDSIPYGISK